MTGHKTADLFDLSHTIAFELLEQSDDPWQVLSKIKDAVYRLGTALDREKFDSPTDGVWIAKSAKVAPTALINPPCIVDEYAEIRHCAFIRGSAIIGKGAVVGNSCEVKNSIIFDGAQLPHFNYCGDSVIGYRAHLSAGVITSNVKGNGTNVALRQGEERMETGLRKFGALVGDFAEIGCNTVLNPGTIVGRRTQIYPQCRIRGVIAADMIYKDMGNVVKKQFKED